MNTEQALRRALVRAGRDLYRQGMMAGASGNLSARLGDGQVIITPSGAAKGRLRPADLLLIDLDGNLVAGDGNRGSGDGNPVAGATTPAAGDGNPATGARRPSSEMAMHLVIYRRFANVQAVVHAHPLKATALATAHRPIPVDTLPEALFALGSIPLVPYLPAATPDLSEAVAAALADGDGALLLNHGAVTIGKSVDAARSKMEILEALADTAIQTHLLGGAVPLPAAEIERLRGIWRQRRWQQN